MSKQIARDEYGAITAGGRQPGTLAELITATENHYHVTKNAVSDPMIEPRAGDSYWTASCKRRVQLDYRTLRQLPTVEIAKTLECISNYVSECSLVPGCDLISTAAWRGVPLKTVLDLAGGHSAAEPRGQVRAQAKGRRRRVAGRGRRVHQHHPRRSRARSGQTLVAYEINGEVLPRATSTATRTSSRVLVPGRYGYKSAKWVRGIRPLNRVVPDWYAQRNWNKDGLVKTMSRIDVPASGAPLAPGQQRIAASRTQPTAGS